MAPDASRKGLWGRVKDALGVGTSDDDELASRPQITSTFTASRLPSADSGPLGTKLFPDRGDQDKWELYGDRWGEDDEQAPPPTGDRAPAAGDVAPPPDVAPPAAGEPPAAGDPPAPVEPEEWQPRTFTPLSDTQTFAPNRSEELSAALEALAGDHDDAAEVLENLDERDVDALARAVGYQDPPSPGRPTQEPRDDVVDEPAGDVADGPAAAGTAEAPPPTTEAPPPVEPTSPAVTDARAREPGWSPSPDVDAVRPRADGNLFAQAPAAEPIEREPTVGPAPTASAHQPVDAPATPDSAGPKPPVAVHEDEIERAASRERVSQHPAVRVHDERLDTPAPPQEMNPSQAVELAQRGRPLPRRDDVNPAS